MADEVDGYTEEQWELLAKGLSDEMATRGLQFAGFRAGWGHDWRGNPIWSIHLSTPWPKQKNFEEVTAEGLFSWKERGTSHGVLRYALRGPACDLAGTFRCLTPLEQLVYYAKLHESGV